MTLRVLAPHLGFWRSNVHTSTVVFHLKSVQFLAQTWLASFPFSLGCSVGDERRLLDPLLECSHKQHKYDQAFCVGSPLVRRILAPRVPFERAKTALSVCMRGTKWTLGAIEVRAHRFSPFTAKIGGYRRATGCDVTRAIKILSLACKRSIRPCSLTIVVTYFIGLGNSLQNFP